MVEPLGEKKTRKQRLLEQNPFCCFCGGVVPSEEEDHIPPRSFFVRREWPEGYSFGACAHCNRESKNSELVAAFYVRWMDHNDENYVPTELQKLLDGVRNNHPEALPRLDLRGNEIRRALKQVSVEMPDGAFLEDASVVGVPKEALPHMKVFARKLTCALFAKETGGAVDLSAKMFTRWTQFHAKAIPQVIAHLNQAMPDVRIGERNRQILRGQFSYMVGWNPQAGVFGFLAQFGKSIFVLGAVSTNPSDWARLDDWRTLSASLSDAGI